MLLNLQVSAQNVNESPRPIEKLSNPKASKQAKKLYKKLLKYSADKKMFSGQMWRLGEVLMKSSMCMK